MRPREMFSPAQVRMACAALGWAAEELADNSGLELEAVELFQDGAAELGEPERLAIGRAFHERGLIAIAETDLAGEGVRFNRPGRANGVRLPRDKTPARFRRSLGAGS